MWVSHPIDSIITLLFQAFGEPLRVHFSAAGDRTHSDQNLKPTNLLIKTCRQSHISRQPLILNLGEIDVQENTGALVLETVPTLVHGAILQWTNPESIIIHDNSNSTAVHGTYTAGKELDMEDMN
jgi:hypothetical protein